MAVSATTPVSMRVNGIDRVVEISSDVSLLDVIRDDLRLTGAKRACDNGECGSCTVLLDGKAAMSCVIAARRAEGKDVVTIEGLAAAYSDAHPEGQGAQLHPLQRAFAESGAAQCGFCTPGMIMEAVPLLERNTNPTRAEVAKRLSRNLCRCTGYVKIVDAVMDAARMLRDEGDGISDDVDNAPSQSGTELGARVAKPDSEDHVTGRSLYAADLPATAALHLKVVRSPHHHARIVHVDTSRARALPGVALVLTADDLPDEAKMLVGRPQPFLLARDRVRFVGEAVVAVAAESEQLVAQAAALIEIEYEPLEPVLDPAYAIDQRSTPLYPGRPNWRLASQVVRGDVEDGFARASVIVQGVYRTAPREHCPLEPEAGVANMEDGVLVIRTPHHHPFAAQGWIARLVGLESERVRIVCPAMGGNFGHRGDFLHSGLLAVTVMRTGRPARIVYTREESILGSGKATSYLIRCRTGADEHGRLTAMSAEIIADGGCWIKQGTGERRVGSSTVATFAPGPYRVPAARVIHVEACTTRPRSIPMRGTDIPDLAFAWESQLDMLAARLQVDPLDLRIRNALVEGDTTISGEILDESVSARATLEALRGPYAAARKRAAARSTGAGPWRPGIGLAGIWMTMGGGRFEEAGGKWHGLKLGPARAAVGITTDGRIRVRSGVVEKGQGIANAIRQITAAELGVPVTVVDVVCGDTARAPFPIATSGQRTMFHAGGAAQLAARKLKRAMLEVAATRLAEQVGDLAFNGPMILSRRTGQNIGLTELAAAFREAGAATDHEAAFALAPTENGNGPVYSYAAQLTELDVNTETGVVQVNRVTYVADPGIVVNRQTFEGQVEGGVVMGLSYALSERFVPGKTTTLSTYGLPKSRYAPEQIDIAVVEAPVDGGPFGAKGMAEMTGSAGIASALNAIAAATGARCFSAPAHPDVVRAAIVAAEQHQSTTPDFPSIPANQPVADAALVSGGAA